MTYVSMNKQAALPTNQYEINYNLVLLLNYYKLITNTYNPDKIMFSKDPGEMG